MVLEMILAINIGNTNTVLGCIDGSKCVFVERISTVKTKTELEYAIDIKNVLDIYHIKKADLEGRYHFVGCSADYDGCKSCG